MPKVNHNITLFAFNMSAFVESMPFPIGYMVGSKKVLMLDVIGILAGFWLFSFFCCFVNWLANIYNT